MAKFTAEAWIAQEFAKVNADNAAARLKSEYSMLDFIREVQSDYENDESYKAHLGLVEKIVKNFDIFG